MNSGYVIEYSTFELEGLKKEERKKGFCSAATLSKMLTSKKYTIWCAHWVNPKLDNISDYEVIQVKN